MKHSFICVAFPKTASTTIDAILREHPDICLPCHKETVFFQENDFDKYGLSWYEKRYYGMKYDPTKIYGEINPRCSSYGNREKTILETWGMDTKFIYTIRNPIDALFSLFKYYALQGTVFEGWYEEGYQKAFDIFLNKTLNNYSRATYEEHLIIKNFLYGRHIATACKYVPHNQIMVIEFADFIHNQKENIKRLLQFIGASTDVDLDYDIKLNDGNRLPKNITSSRIARKKFNFWYHIYVPYFPYMGKKIERKMDSWYWNITIKSSYSVDQQLEMSDYARCTLKEYFYNDVKLLDSVLQTRYAKQWGFEE